MRTRIGDRRAASDMGRARAEDFEVTDDRGKPYYDGLIDADADVEIAHTREEYDEARGASERVEEAACQERHGAQGQQVEALDQDQQDEETERKHAHLRGLGIVGYCFVLVLGYLAALPQDMAAASGLPLPPEIQLVAALTLGAALMLGAHFAGEKLYELEEARPSRRQDPGKYESIKLEVIALIVTPVALILTVAIWRGQTFAAEAKLVGDLFANPLAANAAFTALALVAYLSAVMAARSYFRKKPLSDIRRKRKKNKKTIKVLQDLITACESIEAQERLNQGHLTQEEDQRLAAIDARRDGRKKRLHHRAGISQRKRQRRLINQGLRAPETDDRVGSKASPGGPKNGAFNSSNSSTSSTRKG